MLNKIISSYLIFFILFLAFVVRLHGFTSPVADWHSWRQADTSAVSRNFIKMGFDVFHPRYDDLSNIPSGKDNPHGYRFVEFPIYNLFQAGLFGIIGYFTIEEWGRLVSIFSSLFAIWFLYALVKKYTDTTTGLLVSFFYAVTPYSIYYGRTILPDQMMIMATLGGIYFFDTWISNFRDEHRKKKQIISFILAVLFTAAALLLKPYALFFSLPMLYLAWKEFGFTIVKQWKLYIFALLAILPLILWRIWMTQYPEGIPANDWLLNGGNIRFKGAFFYWVFADRIGRLILGYWGIVFLGFGIIYNSTRKFANIGKRSHIGLFYSFLFASLAYVTVIARGNVQHDYYQILILPSIFLFVGLGARFLLSLVPEIANKYISITLLIVCSLFMLGFGWYFVRDYYNINKPGIVEAGKAVDSLTPKSAKVIAPYDGDTAFLYQTNRQGWPAYEKDLQGLIGLGAEYLVLVNPNQNDRNLRTQYHAVSESSNYILVDLHKTK
jgi:hypothetical protein